MELVVAPNISSILGQQFLGLTNVYASSLYLASCFGCDIFIHKMDC